MTEGWERFPYYRMVALLSLYAAIAAGGGILIALFRRRLAEAVQPEPSITSCAARSSAAPAQ